VEFAGGDLGRAGGDEIAQGIGRVVAANAFFVEVGFEDVAGAIGVVLQVREGFDQAAAAGVNEEGGKHAGIRVAQALQDGGPVGHAIRGRRLEAEVEVAILAGDGGAAVFVAEDVGAGDEAGETPGLEVVPQTIALGTGFGKARSQRFGQVLGAQIDVMTGEQGLDGRGVTLGNPVVLGVFVEDIEVVRRIATAQEHDVAMGVAVVHSGEPFDGVRLAETVQPGEGFTEGGIPKGGSDGGASARGLTASGVSVSRPKT
jgi:hypothetical protein